MPPSQAMDGSKSTSPSDFIYQQKAHSFGQRGQRHGFDVQNVCDYRNNTGTHDATSSFPPHCLPEPPQIRPASFQNPNHFITSRPISWPRPSTRFSPLFKQEPRNTVEDAFEDTLFREISESSDITMHYQEPPRDNALETSNNNNSSSQPIISHTPLPLPPPPPLHQSLILPSPPRRYRRPRLLLYCLPLLCRAPLLLHLSFPHPLRPLSL